MIFALAIPIMTPGASSSDTFQIDQTIFDLPRDQSKYWIADLRVGQKALVAFDDICTHDDSLFVNATAEIVADTKDEDRLEVTITLNGASIQVIPEETPSPRVGPEQSRILDFSDLPYRSEILDQIFFLKIGKKGGLFNCVELSRIFSLYDNEEWLSSLVPVVSVNGTRSLSEMTLGRK